MIDAVALVRAATTALFLAGMAAFGLSAVVDLAVHLGLWNVPERPAHVAIVGSMAVIAVALVLRGSFVTPEREEIRHAHR